MLIHRDSVYALPLRINNIHMREQTEYKTWKLKSQTRDHDKALPIIDLIQVWLPTLSLSRKIPISSQSLMGEMLERLCLFTSADIVWELGGHCGQLCNHWWAQWEQWSFPNSWSGRWHWLTSLGLRKRKKCDYEKRGHVGKGSGWDGGGSQRRTRVIRIH